jgi:ATP-binding cassette, subfamily B, bacterial PglK
VLKIKHYIKHNRKIFLFLVDRFNKEFYFSIILILFSSIYEIVSLLLLIPYVEILQKGKLTIGESKVNSIIENIINTLGINTKMDLLIFSSIFISLVFFIGFFVKYIASRYSIKITFKIAHDLNKTGYLSLVNSPYNFIRSENSSEFISLISIKTTQIVYGYFLSLYSLINGIFIFGFLLLFILLINPKTGILVLLSLSIIFSILIYLKGDKVTGRGEKISEKNSQIVRFIQETRGFIRQIFLYKLGDFFVNKFNNLDSESKKLQFENQWEGTYPKFFVESTVLTIIPLIVVFSIIFSSSLISNGNDLVSTSLKLFVFLIISIQRLLPVVNQMYVGIISIKGTQGSINDYFRLVKKSKLKTNDTIATKTVVFKDKIALNNISFGYSTDNFVFKDLSLILRKSEKVALVGKSGSGKSTFIDLISGLNLPERGNIMIDQLELTNINRSLWSEKITYIPQEDFFMDDSLINNILLGSKNDKIDFERIKWACKIALIDEFIELSRSGLSVSMGENGNKFSGGQKQRVGIARALYRKSDLLIFDESTSSLDSEIEKKIVKNIFESLKEQTIIFVTHKLELLKHFDQILTVKNKKIKFKIEK